MKTKKNFRFKVEIKPIHSKQNSVPHFARSWRLPSMLGNNAGYSVEVSDLSKNGNGPSRNFNFSFRLEKKADVGSLKQICMDSNFAILHLRSDNDWLANMAQLKINYSKDQAIRVLDFCNDYKTLAKAVKANRF